MKEQETISKYYYTSDKTKMSRIFDNKLCILTFLAKCKEND